MKHLALVLGITALITGPAFALDPGSINWPEVPTKDITLFYPGESTYDWLRSPEHENAQRETIAGQSCISCHAGEEADFGNALVVEGPLEPDPIPDKNGVLNLAVQAAHDDEYLYFRFQWKTNMDREGRMHNMIRYDGTEWKWYGAHRAADSFLDGDQPAIYEDRLAIMLDDGSVEGFAEQGCWLACHTSMRNMEDRPDSDEVKDNFYLGEILGKSDVRKYLPLSRTSDEAHWDEVKTPEEIAALKADGQFLDLMQWRVARSNPVGMADDGYVLEYRLFDEGTKMFSWNLDRSTMIPKFMFDEAKVGFTALREEDFTDYDKPTFIIKEQNGVPYDANAGFVEGDILPGRLLTALTEGSAGDNDWARGTWDDSMYTVVFRRKLDTGHPLDDKIMEVGGVYTIGLAVHDDNVTTRFHQVSFPLSLGIGTAADIEAVTLD